MFSESYLGVESFSEVVPFDWFSPPLLKKRSGLQNKWLRVYMRLLLWIMSSMRVKIPPKLVHQYMHVAQKPSPLTRWNIVPYVQCLHTLIACRTRHSYLWVRHWMQTCNFLMAQTLQLQVDDSMMLRCHKESATLFRSHLWISWIIPACTIRGSRGMRMIL